MTRNMEQLSMLVFIKTLWFCFRLEQLSCYKKHILHSESYFQEGWNGFSNKLHSSPETLLDIACHLFQPVDQRDQSLVHIAPQDVCKPQRLFFEWLYGKKYNNAKII